MKLPRVVLLASFAVAGILALSPNAAQAQAKEWKVGSVSPETVSWGAFTLEFSKHINAGSGGKIKAIHYPSMQLGNNTQLIENVRLGVVEATCAGTSFLSNFLPSYAAFQLPFLFDDFDHMEAFFTGEYMEKRLADVEALGMKGLAWVTTTGRNPLMKSKFIRTPSDMRGLKIRVEGNRLLEDVIRALGANPVSIEFGEVYTAMQTGVVDALVFERQTIAAMKYHEIAKYMSEASMYPFPGILLMNLDVWKSLNSDQQAMVKQAAKKSQQFYFERARKEDSDLIPVLREQGLQTEKIDVAPFRKAIEPVYTKYMKSDKRIAEIVTEVRRLKKR